MIKASVSAAGNSRDRIALIETGILFSSITFPARTFRIISSILLNPLWYLGEGNTAVEYFRAFENYNYNF